MREPSLNWIRKPLKALGFLSLFCLLTAATKSTDPVTKKEAIHFLTTYSQANQKHLAELDTRLREVLMKTYNSDLSPQLGPKKEMALAREIEVLTLKRKEHRLRSDFIDRLVFNIDRKYKGGNWKNFLSQQIIEMASIEASAPSADVGMVKFCGFLSAAVKKIPEKSEDVFSFIEGYIDFSTLLDPRPPSEYVRHRSYTNGSQSAFKKGVSRENVGDLVEERLARLSYLKSLQRKSFEDRAPVLKPLGMSFDLPTLPNLPLPSRPVQEVGTEAAMNLTTQAEESSSMDASGLEMRIQLKQIHSEDSDQDSSAVAPDELNAKDANYEGAL